MRPALATMFALLAVACSGATPEDVATHVCDCLVRLPSQRAECVELVLRNLEQASQACLDCQLDLACRELNTDTCDAACTVSIE